MFAVVTSLIPSDPAQLFQKGLAGFEQGSRAQLTAAITGLESEPDYKPELQLLQGLELLSVSRPLKAIEVLEAAAQEPRIRNQALSYLGQALARGDNRLKAIEVLDEAVRASADNPFPHYLLGEILHDIGAYERALQELDLFTQGTSSPAPASAPTGGTPAASGTTSNDNTRRARAFGLRGDMLIDLGRPKEAAVEFEKAISVSAVNPENSSYAIKRVQSLISAGALDEANKAIDGVDPGAAKDAERVILLVAAGEIEKASEIVAEGLKLPGADPSLQRLNAKVKSRTDKATAEKSLSELRFAVPNLSRDADFFESLAEVAKLAERADEAAVYAENARRLRELKTKYHAQVAATSGDLKDAAGRIAAGDLAAEIGLYEPARSWYLMASMIDPSATEQIGERLQAIYLLKPELVSTTEFRAQADDPTTGTPAGQPDAAGSTTNPAGVTSEKPADEAQKPAEEAQKPADEEQKPADEGKAGDTPKEPSGSSGTAGDEPKVDEPKTAD